MNDRDLIVIDIETIPDQGAMAVKDIELSIKPPAAMKKQETIDDWHNGAGKYKGVKNEAIKEAYLKTSFDGSYGQIVCICASINGVIRKYTDKEMNEDELLTVFWDDVKKQTVSPFFVAHNAKFDLPFIYKRSVINGVDIPVLFKPFGRHGSQYHCTMEAWEGFNGRIKLDTLAKILKVGKKTEGIDGSKVFGEWQDGNIDKISDYCRDDVQLTLDIYNKQTFQS